MANLPSGLKPATIEIVTDNDPNQKWKLDEYTGELVEDNELECLNEINSEVEYQKRLDGVLSGMVAEGLISEKIREETFRKNKYLAD